MYLTDQGATEPDFAVEHSPSTYVKHVDRANVIQEVCDNLFDYSASASAAREDGHAGIFGQFVQFAYEPIPCFPQGWFHHEKIFEGFAIPFQLQSHLFCPATLPTQKFFHPILDSMDFIRILNSLDERLHLCCVVPQKLEKEPLCSLSSQRGYEGTSKGKTRPYIGQLDPSRYRCVCSKFLTHSSLHLSYDTKSGKKQIISFDSPFATKSELLSCESDNFV